MDLLVVGGSGLVGSNIADLASNSGIDVRTTYNTTSTERADIQLDKTDEARTRGVIEDMDPDVIVDTAAFHSVDDCETKRELAWAVNATGTRNVAVAANAVDAHLLYLSTDYVFPGDSGEAPYIESDPVAPINYYGETKYAGECAARIASKSTILRPSVIYGLNSGNFVTWALSELREGNEVGIVDDQTSAPTYAPDLAAACIEIARTDLTGLYHATGPASQSRYEFTRTLADVYDLDHNLVEPTTTAELGQTAPRPENSTLDSTKLYSSIETTFRPPNDAFEEMQTTENSTN